MWIDKKKKRDKNKTHARKEDVKALNKKSINSIGPIHMKISKMHDKNNLKAYLHYPTHILIFHKTEQAKS